MSRPNPDQDRHQAEIEAMLGQIGIMLVLLDHDTLRVNQAIRRSGLSDLLSPVAHDHQQIRDRLQTLSNRLRKLWAANLPQNGH
jgi:hypothetical protein